MDFPYSINIAIQLATVFAKGHVFVCHLVEKTASWDK